MNQERPSTDQVVSLASLLNMLWRQRLFVLGLPALGLVVALLYGIFSPRSWGATVTVRPGITAFGPDGTAVRQWRLKDITRWYDKQLYAREVVQRLGLPSGSRIVIESEYMAPGLHDYVGGDVITLWTIARSPELAAAILDSSIQVFSEFSETETVGSQLQLTRDHLELQIRRQEANLSRLQAEELLLGLQIESSRAESLLVHVEDGHLRLELEQRDQREVHLDQRLNAVRAEEPLLADDLAKLDQTLRRLTATADAGLQAPVEIPSWVRRDAILDSSTVLESLTRAKLHVQQALALNRTLQDSLAFEAELNRLERRKIEVQREIHIAAKLREASRKIGQLVLEQNIALPARRQAVLADIDENRVKLGTISSLQRLGKTVVSERPVRPRPLRAGLILVLAGGAAGIVLGIVWDYLRANRRVVFRS